MPLGLPRADKSRMGMVMGFHKLIWTCLFYTIIRILPEESGTVSYELQKFPVGVPLPEKLLCTAHVPSPDGRCSEEPRGLASRLVSGALQEHRPRCFPVQLPVTWLRSGPDRPQPRRAQLVLLLPVRRRSCPLYRPARPSGCQWHQTSSQRLCRPCRAV